MGKFQSIYWLCVALCYWLGLATCNFNMSSTQKVLNGTSYYPETTVHSKKDTLKDKLSTPVAIAIGGGALLLVVCLVCSCCWCRRKKHHNKDYYAAV